MEGLMKGQGLKVLGSLCKFIVLKLKLVLIEGTKVNISETKNLKKNILPIYFYVKPYITN